jgi:hypothetical protein
VLAYAQCQEARYEEVAEEYAACKFNGSKGGGIIHPEIATVIELHGERCRATRNLPIA